MKHVEKQFEIDKLYIYTNNVSDYYVNDEDN